MATNYYYQVDEFVTTFGKDPGKNKPFSHTEFFRHNDLHEARKCAFEYYKQRLNGFEKNGGYFLPFASPENFVEGKNSNYSITLYLVEVGETVGEIFHPIAGEDTDEVRESLELEKMVLNLYK
jgi:hypothetical protein